MFPLLQHIVYGEGFQMDLMATLGLIGVLAAIAGFLVYFISLAMNFDDAKRIDKVPPNDFNEE